MIGGTYQSTGVSSRKATKAVFSSVKGENTRDHPSRIAADNLEICENYFIEGDGRLITREGLSLKVEITHIIPLSSISGTYSVGETVSQTTPSASGIVVAFFSTGASAGNLYLKDVTGTFQGSETITGGTSGATGTSATPKTSLSPNMLEEFTGQKLVFSFEDGTSTHVCIGNMSTNGVEVIKIFASTDNCAGKSFGKYFYASNGAEKIGVFHETAKFLNYDAETAAFNVGFTLTGGTSGATGTIIALLDSGTTGTLVVDSITGTFQDNETITDNGSVPGSATANGAAYRFYTITDAPKAKILEIYTRLGRPSVLLAGNTDSGAGFVDYRIQGSKAHTDPLAIPFLTFTPTLSGGLPVDGSAFVSLFNEGGTMNDIKSHKDKMYVFSNDAIGIFHLEVQNIDGIGAVQYALTDTAEKNFGGFRAQPSIYGTLYDNENGIFLNQIELGQQVDSEPSQVIKYEEIKTYDFSDSDILWDGRRYFYITLGRNTSVNNYVKVYDVLTGSLSSFTGWNLKRLARISSSSDIYGIGSREMKIWKLLDGYNDDGLDINWRIRYRQENEGDPVMLKDATEAWHQGVLSPSSVIKVSYNLWGRDNSVTEEGRSYYWIGGNEGLQSLGYDVDNIDDLIQSGDVLIGESFINKFYPFQNFLKYQVELTSSGQVRHEIHMPYMLETVDKYRVQMDNVLAGNSYGGSPYVDDGDSLIVL